jgi:hypothetical protein
MSSRVSARQALGVFDGVKGVFRGIFNTRGWGQNSVRLCYSGIDWPPLFRESAVMARKPRVRFPGHFIIIYSFVNYFWG